MSSLLMSAEDPQTALSLSNGETTQEVLDEILVEATVAAGATEERESGRLGRPFDRRAPFRIGFVGALGAACAFAVGWLVVAAGQILIPLGLAFFITVGLDPAVRWLYRAGVPAWCCSRTRSSIASAATSWATS